MEEALALHQNGQLDLASAIYRQLIEEDTKNSDALHLLGVIALQTYDYQVAIELINQAIKVGQSKPIYFFNLGVAHSGIKQLTVAIECYAKAILVKPEYYEAYYNKGILLQELKEYKLAICSFHKVIELKPDFAMAYFNLGNALKALSRFDEAITNYDQAIFYQPNYAEAFSNRGMAFKELNQIESALNSYDQALAINPILVEAFFNKGNAYIEDGRWRESFDSFNKVYKIKPETNWLLGLRLLCKASLCDWDTWSQDLLGCEAQINLGKPVIASLTSLIFFDDPLLHRSSANICALEKFPLNHQLGVLLKRVIVEKIKIGYFSADLNYHPVSIWLAEQLENHDKSKFELYAFCLKSVQDPMRDRLEAAFDHWIDVTNLSDLELTKLSRELGIDIAIDLNGHTADGRPGIFAARAAPIQVNHLGFPGSMGAEYIDYMLGQTLGSEEALEDWASTRPFITEKIAYVPSAFTYDRQRQVSDELLTRAQYGLPEKAFVFTCQNGCQKLMPEVFDIWMEILKAVPGSVLWLLKPNETAMKNLIKEANARGVDAERLIFTAREVVPLDQEKARIGKYLASYKLADLFLDTWPYNAGTTAVDALWAGLPVLTKKGKSLVARMATEALRGIEVPELITKTPEEYKELAIELAHNPDKLKQLKEKVQRNRLTTALFDPVANTRHIENAYLEMYRRYQEDMAAEDFFVKEQKLN